MSAPSVELTLLAFAAEVADQAGRLAAERFYEDPGVATKRDGTEVTPADIEVERFIRERLAARFPSDAVYGEEGGDSVIVDVAGGGAPHLDGGRCRPGPAPPSSALARCTMNC
jgi:fructose-1,6-bisphosphatase/inositol monophosphatase family enzyme